MRLLALGVACLLTACASTRNHAPVEVRSAPAKQAATASGGGVSGDASAAQAIAERPGYYTVKPGDTLLRIALDNGQNWKDLARWNALDNPNLIEVGQVLRVVPPGVDPTVAGVRPTATAKVEAKPLEARAASAPSAASAGVSASSAASAASGAATSASAAAVAAPATVAAAPTAVQGDDALSWMWPANGSVIAAFDEVKSKGLAIAGKAGDPVVAAADGRVVYAGSGLRGYGNLVIVKHNATYLTAYAHNQTLLVKEDQAVRRGQKIAEMGSTDAERVQLHFEIRKLGKPVDPAKLLPAR